MPTQPGPSGPPVRSRFASDPEMAELIGLYVRELPSRVEAIRAAWADRQLEVLTRLVHQLSGASAGYGFAPIGDSARRVEGLLRTMKDDADQVPAGLQSALDELIELCQRATA